MTPEELRADERHRALGQLDTASNYQPPKPPGWTTPNDREVSKMFEHVLRHAIPELEAVAGGLASGVMVESVAAERVAALADDFYGALRSAER